MKKRLGIIPFLKNNYPLIMYPPPDVKINSVIAPQGAGIEGNDISILRNRENTGINGLSNIEEGYNNCDVILITDVGLLKNCENEFKYLSVNKVRDYAKNALDNAITHNKDIICFSSLDKSDQKKYLDLCKSKGIKFEYYEQKAIESDTPQKLKQINIPIVLIAETIYDNDGYEIFLKLIQSFNLDNKKVLAISEDKYNVLYKQYSVTFWNNTDPELNVIGINNYVARLADEIKPDVILIKLPKPMTKFDDEITFDFGMTAFLLSQALKVDYMIYCSLYSLVDPQLMSSLNENFISKYGYPISAIHVANQITDTQEDLKEIMQTSFIDHKNNMKAIRESTNMPFYNLNNTEDYNEFYKKLKDELFDFSYGVIAL